MSLRPLWDTCDCQEKEKRPEKRKGEKLKRVNYKSITFDYPTIYNGVLNVPDTAQGTGFECYSEVDLSLE